VNVRVVLCTYNRAQLLRRALAALAAQRTAPGLTWELVLVDNNSNDGTKDVIEAFMPSSPFPIRYLFEGRQGKSIGYLSGYVKCALRTGQYARLRRAPAGDLARETRAGQ
jgi:glycosyltransferase involved in cell wall biosynthesis